MPFSGPHCPRLPRDLARGRSAASRSGHDAATASNAAAAAATATQQESERVSPPRAPAAPPQLEVHEWLFSGFLTVLIPTIILLPTFGEKLSGNRL